MKPIYHGTDKASKKNILKKGIRLDVNRAECDFGPGFYLTPNKGIAKERGDGSILAYNLDLRNLQVKKYASTSAEWATEVFQQRYLKHDVSKDFDCVIGPIADGKMRLLLALLKQGAISFEKFRLEISKGKKPKEKQIALKTQKALNQLHRWQEKE